MHAQVYQAHRKALQGWRLYECWSQPIYRLCRCSANPAGFLRSSGDEAQVP